MKFVQAVLVAIILHLAGSNPVPGFQPLSADGFALLDAWSPETKQPMWELSGQFEGDIIPSPETRNGVVNTRLRWRKKVIVYQISNEFSLSEKNFIASVLTKGFAKTCVRFRQRTIFDRDYVYVTGKNSGCWSSVGRVGGRQQLNLQKNGCIYDSVILHEFMHAAGFYHQQSATDRDFYIDILWKNIQQGQEHNFKKFGPNIITSFGQKYDYDSIMHYTRYAFSTNGQPTIVPKDPNAVIGEGTQLSHIDEVKVNKMYGCR